MAALGRGSDGLSAAAAGPAFNYTTATEAERRERGQSDLDALIAEAEQEDDEAGLQMMQLEDLEAVAEEENDEQRVQIQNVPALNLRPNDQSQSH